MPGIVCAIRGGPASRPTIHKAIRLATDRELELYFLYVINLDFLVRTASSRTQTISNEMEGMGEFILLTAQTEAEKQGIEAKGITRKGQVGDEIINLCQEIDTSYVVLGKPKGPEEENVFTHERISAFAERLQQEGNVEVVFAEDE